VVPFIGIFVPGYNPIGTDVVHEAADWVANAGVAGAAATTRLASTRLEPDRNDMNFLLLMWFS
jgi:hypothetical protein